MIFGLAFNTQMSTDVNAAPNRLVRGKQSHRLAQISLIIILFILLTGCGRVSESKINEILEKDPQFEKYLNRKKQIASKISDLKNSYRREKGDIAGKIRALKTILKNKRNNQSAAILSLEAEIQPNIRSLRAVLEEKRSEYALKKREFRDSLAKSADIRKLLEKKKELGLSSDELSVWNKRVQKLEKAIAALSKTLEGLCAKTRLIKTEIRILEE